MQVDPRLNDIDDSLYRVAVRALIVQDRRVLLVKEVDGGDLWAIPGGGIDHGETIESCLLREVEEELGVPAQFVSSDLQIAKYDIGRVVNGIPRMNIYFKVLIPKDKIHKTSHVERTAWLTEKEFLEVDMNPSYNKVELIKVIFG